MWTKPLELLMKYFHYMLGVVLLEWGKNGCIRSQWHFLKAYDFSPKLGEVFKEKIAKYLLEAEVMEIEKGISLESFYSSGRATTIRYERAMVKYKGDEKKLNIPLFLTCPE